MQDEDDRIFYDTAKEGDAILITGNFRHYPNEPFIMKPSAFWALIKSKDNKS
jgi:predicted nucleic acid-binding protein